VGIDVGGTFTDIVVYDTDKNESQVLKLPTTPKNPGEAIVEGLSGFRKRAKEVGLISHASTIATNALLTHTGLARAALVTNRGFRDVLEIARQRRPELYDLYARRPIPIVERKDRFTVHGRMLADGNELEPLDLREAKAVSKEIVEGRFQSVVVAFLNSYRNPEHERLMETVPRKTGFAGWVNLSSDVDREYREYERMSTTVVNAALSPLISSYLSSLRTMLDGAGFTAPVYMMNSDGGMNTLNHASQYPITVIESGPAAGVLASKQLADALSLDRVLTFDMGGTTAKAGTIVDGVPDVSYEFEAAGRSHSGRSIKGSGYAVRTSFIDLAEVSAGGGTLAWVDDGGALQVGPESAGAEPGPAAYGKGGKRPTVTDANVVLGRINPQYLLGGKMPIFADLARESMGELSDAVGLVEEKVAEGVIRLVDNNMAKAISMVSVERGRDPREFAMVAFGGAGPLHCCNLADGLGFRRIIVPVHAGLFSASGLLAADVTRNFVLPVLSTNGTVGSFFDDLESTARQALLSEGFDRYSLNGFVDVRYRGQSHELTIPCRRSSDVRRLFRRKHRALYGYDSADEIEIVNLRLRARIRVSRMTKRFLRHGKVRSNASQSRRVWFGGMPAKVPVYIREEAPLGSSGTGPCVIEEYDSTLVVNRGWAWTIQEYGTELNR